MVNQGTGAKKLRLLIVDGLGLLTKQFKNHLDAQDDIEVVRVADDASGAIEDHQDLRPDVVLVDILVTGGTGVAAARLVRDRFPDAALVLLSGGRSANWMLTEFVGVAAFLPITSSAATVVDVIRQAAQGRRAPTAMHRRGVGSRAGSGSVPERDTAGKLLSARDRQLLQLISLGLTSKVIAEELGLTPNTARTYTQRLLEKLDAHSKIEAVGKAIRLGLIEP